MEVACQIFIQTPRDGVHKAGRPVRGSVRYTVEGPTEFQDIILSLVGKGKCSWTETHSNVGNNRRQRSVTYEGTEVILSNYMSIVTKKPGFTAFLPAGTYEYQFKFELPKNIPSSFKNSTCTIAYRIGLKFIKPNLFSCSKKFTTAINVIGFVKFVSPEGNVLFDLKKSLVRPLSKRNHIISLQTGISNSLISPGHNANISFAITNNTDVKITSVKTELICYKTYTANCGRRKFGKKMIFESTVDTPSIPADSIVNMTVLMPVPAHLYSIQNCKIMEQEYKVKVTLKLPMPYINASKKHSIVIGKKRDDEVALFAGDVFGYTDEAVPGMEDAPPSYWEVMNEDKEEKENY